MVIATSDERFRTRAGLRADLERLGVGPGDTVMVHAALRRVGRMLNGPDALVDAFVDAASGGTVLAYTDWDARYDELLDPDRPGRVLEQWREHVPPFDPSLSRASGANGAFPEFLRTWPGARRSANPGASVAALGAGAEAITANHPLDYGYGPGSPLAKLVLARGKVVMVGAPLDTMTLLHHAEHLAQIPGKRLRREETPLATESGVWWRMTEEFETAEPVVAGLDDDYFATIVTEFLALGQGTHGPVGNAPSLLVDVAAIIAFAVEWLERTAAADQHPGDKLRRREGRGRVR